MQASVSPEAYLDLLKEWPTAVGRFILAVSSCEYWTYIFLRILGSESLYASLVDKSLKYRIDHVRSLAKTRVMPERLRNDLLTTMRKLRNIAKRRNLVAHNAPMSHVYKNSETGEIVVRWELRSSRDHSKEVTLDNLDKWFRETIELEQSMALLMGDLSKAARESKARRP